MQEEIVMETTKGPGEKLKHTRMSFGLTINDIANQLYLPHHVLHALEENDYHAQLPARAFIRGYLRSYAKLLNLPAEEILSDFDALGIYKTPQEENIKSLAQPRLSLTIHKDKFWFSVVGGGLLGVLLLIAGLTWLNTSKEKNEDLVNQSLQQEENIPASVVGENDSAEMTKPEVTAMTMVELPLNETVDSPSDQKAEAHNLEVASSQTTTVQATVMPEEQTKQQVEPTATMSDSPVAEAMLTPVDAPMPVAQLEVQ